VEGGIRVDVPPFTYFVPRLSFDYSVVSSIDRVLHLVELDMIDAGLRVCDVYHVSPRSMYEELREVFRRNLYFKPIDYVRAYSGFAHKHERPTSIDDTMVFGVVCLTKDYADEFEFYYRSGDHDNQGRLLGYPDCDRRFFVRYWGEGWLDLVYPQALATGMKDGVVEDYDPRLLTTMRYAGIRVLPYFACSFRCPKSIDMANEVEKLIRRRDSSVADAVVRLLSLPHRWSMVNGIIYVETQLFKIVAGGYLADRELYVKFKGYASVDATQMV